MGLSRGSRRGVDHRSGYRLGALDARWRELAGGVEDRIGDGANMRMDARQITQYVEVERAGVDAFDAPLAQARQMVFRRRALGIADRHLLVKEQARDLDVARDEHAKRELEVVEHAPVKRRQLGRAVLGAPRLVLYLLCGEIHQIF